MPFKIINSKTDHIAMIIRTPISYLVTKKDSKCCKAKFSLSTRIWSWQWVKISINLSRVILITMMMMMDYKRVNL